MTQYQSLIASALQNSSGSENSEGELKINEHVPVEIPEVNLDGEDWCEVAENPTQFDFGVKNTGIQTNEAISIEFLTNMSFSN